MNPIKRLLMGKEYSDCMNVTRERAPSPQPRRDEEYQNRTSPDYNEGGCSRRRRTEENEPFDQGNKPTVINLNRKTMANNMYRKALWTAEHLQLVLMSVDVGDEIAMEKHDGTDQLLFLQRGNAEVSYGNRPESLRPMYTAKDGDVITVPDGTYHRVRNTGNMPLKIFTVYAPPEHPYNTEER